MHRHFLDMSESFLDVVHFGLGPFFCNKMSKKAYYKSKPIRLSEFLWFLWNLIHIIFVYEYYRMFTNIIECLRMLLNVYECY